MPTCTILLITKPLLLMAIKIMLSVLRNYVIQLTKDHGPSHIPLTTVDDETATAMVEYSARDLTNKATSFNRA